MQIVKNTTILFDPLLVVCSNGYLYTKKENVK